MIATAVLRSGGIYGPEHLWAIKRILGEHLPGVPFRYLSDVCPGPWRVPLLHNWPGWWAKLELCRPDITGPVLFLDLDTVVLGDLAPLTEDTSTSIACRDFFRGAKDRHALQSSLMLLTEEDRALVWEAWHDRGPAWWMSNATSDQIVIESALRGRVRFWQDTHPGMVVGYKTDLAHGKRLVPDDARVVIFHGTPRPWDSGHEWAVRPWAA